MFKPEATRVPPGPEHSWDSLPSPSWALQIPPASPFALLSLTLRREQPGAVRGLLGDLELMPGLAVSTRADEDLVNPSCTPAQVK